MKLDLEKVRAVKDVVYELAKVLETDGPKANPGSVFIENELVAVALLLTTVDDNIAPHELDFINIVRRVLSDGPVQPLRSTERMDLFRTFLHLYPGSTISMDHVPLTIQYLAEYDRTHGTNYAAKGRKLFADFADAIVQADGRYNSYEHIALLNFKEIICDTSSLGAGSR